MTRPTKLTPEITSLVADALRLGATRRDAVLAAGVSYQTFLNWLEKGRQKTRGVYVDFFESVERSEADARLRFTKVIAKAAAEGDWRAAEAFLRRRDPQNWGDQKQVTVNLDIDWANLTDEQLQRIIDGKPLG